MVHVHGAWNNERALRMDRRTFLKLAGMGSVAFAAGCDSHPERKLYTLVHAPEEMVTGEATWYATTCRECPAGCGVLVKNREGRAIKLEGNPLHPVNRGRLCVRGHAALQGLYNPDRIKKPLIRIKEGWQEISYGQAFSAIRQRIVQASARGANRVGMLTEAVGQPLLDLFEAVLAQNQSKGPLVFEPLAFEPLKFAFDQLFGHPMLPAYRMDQADLLIGMGADFLETWLSPVEYNTKFKAMHAVHNGVKGRFVQISPFRSLTGENADRWLACRPGSEATIVLGLINGAISRGRGGGWPATFREAIARVARPFDGERVAADSGVPAADLDQLTDLLLRARRPLIMPTGTAAMGMASAAADMAVLLLNGLLDPTFALFDFERRHRVEIAASRATVQNYWHMPFAGPLDILLLNNVNPRLHLPAGGARNREDHDPFTIAFTNFMDETAAAAHMIVPTQLPLECWDVYDSKQGFTSLLQPTVGRGAATASIGDIFLALVAPDFRPASDYRQYLIKAVVSGDPDKAEQGWIKLLQTGGQFEAGAATPPPAPRFDLATAERFQKLIAELPAPPANRTLLMVTPSLRLYDGRGVNRPWLAEIPEPVTQIAWQTPLLVAAETMKSKGWQDGDRVAIATAQGGVEAPLLSYPGLHPAAMVMTMGQGRQGFGRYAKGRGLDPLALLANNPDLLSGAPDFSVEIKSLRKVIGEKVGLARVSGSRDPHGRKIALSVALAEAAAKESIRPGLTMWDFPLTPPMGEGYDRRRDFYTPHDHDRYRWGMVVDLDRCTGCSACVAGCQSENNIGMVGEEQIVRGREMSWIRIERYQDLDDPRQALFLPMMCQHCDNAPCESVCPVYAPHHSKEGLNNQVYNRCIGTRFCAQNCPYKVRRFNWFEWQWPEPLEQQLNPDVTVRSKGVMEKCSFCVQRIKAAHNRAKNENRLIRDGEVVPACVQTCPTGALIFGNLMDPASFVGKLIDDPRAYQVMGYLNTKPAVIYLKKVVQAI
jgi:molybdopterin-containing oxidoreductase family iron-sulfur binding subunit